MTKISKTNEKDWIKQASILSKALPYMQKYSGKNITIKIGGYAMENPKITMNFARDVTLLKQVGINPLIVHGGGPRIKSTLEKFKVKSEFIDGLRVTNKDSMKIIEMVLSGSINKEIVTEINKEGGKAIGISGKDAILVEARRLKNIANKNSVQNNLGLVGEPTKINSEFLFWCLQSNFIPVIAPIGIDNKFSSLNINADILAGKVASSVKSERLVMLTDVKGVMDNNGNILTHLSTKDIKKLISSGTISGGMIPKVNTCLEAIKNGVKAAVILDGTFPHAILLEIFTEHGAGTLITT